MAHDGELGRLRLLVLKLDWQVQVLQHTLKQTGKKIMSKIGDFIVAQEAFNARMTTATDSIHTSVTGLTEDIATLNTLILELQNSPDRVTPEDQARLDAIVAASSALADKSDTVSTALAALDALTPPPVPPAPPEP